MKTIDILPFTIKIRSNPIIIYNFTQIKFFIWSAIDCDMTFIVRLYSSCVTYVQLMSDPSTSGFPCCRAPCRQLLFI